MGLLATPALNSANKDAKVPFCVRREAESATPKDQAVVTAGRAGRGSLNNNFFAGVNIALDRTSPRIYDNQCLLKDPLSRKDVWRVFRFLSPVISRRKEYQITA